MLSNPSPREPRPGGLAMDVEEIPAQLATMVTRSLVVRYVFSPP